MRFVLDIDPDTYERVLSLIRDRRYRDLQEFASAAFVNQLTIEGQEAGSPFELDVGHDFSVSSQEDVPGTHPGGRSQSGIGRNSVKWDQVSTVAMPRPDGPFSGYIWGQYNKFLPLKVALRQLASVSVQKGPWVELSKIQRLASQAAAHIGGDLRRAESRLGKDLLERLSTGFPKGFSEVKSIERFESQFVGHITKDGVIYGMPGNIGFANIVEKAGHTLIGLTKLGLEFCRLTNPVIDNGKLERPLSQEEADSYLDHVTEALPKECRAMRLILNAIEENKDSPDQMTERLRTLRENWSGAVLNTMRVGLLSRMWDLGLIQRNRAGQRVDYSLTDRGTTWLEDVRQGPKEVGSNE
ncbi:MAG: hypothetical protein ACE5IJ_07225 [Thermoplasmata archaeon]